MKRSDAVHTPFICSQGGAKCRKPSSRPPRHSPSSSRLAQRFCDGFSCPYPFILTISRPLRPGRPPRAHLVGTRLDQLQRDVTSHATVAWKGATSTWRNGTQRGWPEGPFLCHIPWRSGAAARLLAPPDDALVGGHRRGPRRRLFGLPWDVPNAADLARRRMGA